MKKYLILVLFILAVFLLPNSYFQIPNSIFAQTENPWPMAAHDSQRTNATPEQVTGNYSANTIKNLWYRPIEAYIPQHVQIIAVNGTLFISTSRGLYALDASTGAVKWTYDTEMPLGNSPTIYNGVGYVPAKNFVGKAEILFFSIAAPNPAWANNTLLFVRCSRAFTSATV